MKASHLALLSISLFFIACSDQPSDASKPLPKATIGDSIDAFNGVTVYYNGGKYTATHGRNTVNGYNLGLKWQCVEFVKRYYYEALNHKMPNPWGHAKDFFNPALRDGQMNPDRGLLQFKNGGKHQPQVHDLVVLGSSWGNSFGHVAIITEVTEDEIETINQNIGRGTRKRYDLDSGDDYWEIESNRILGWLRKP